MSGVFPWSIGQRPFVRLRILGLATLCAVLTVAVALPSSGDGRAAKVLGKTRHTPKPACPKNCKAIGSVTGFMLKADGVRAPFRAKEDGRLLAWAIKLSTPDKDQRDFFGTLWATDKWGKVPTARIAVIKHVKKGKHGYRLLRESPVVDLSHSYGQLQYVTLGHPLRIRKGQILALTLPTWAPTLAVGLPKDENSWRASRSPKRCPGTIPNAKASRPHTKVKSIRPYGCRYTGARLDYWGFYRPT